MSYIGRQLNVPASTTQLTAEGAITAGKPCIVEADGDVSEVKQVAVAQAIGSHVEPETNAAEYIDGTFDSTNNKVVFVYDDENADAAEAIIGTISGTTISFGTPVAFDTAPEYLRVTFNPETGKIVAAYRDGDNSSYGTAVVGTVSGTSISFGSPVVYASENTPYIDIESAGGSNVVILYRSQPNNQARAIVGAVSGTSISFGSAAGGFSNSSSMQWPAVAYDSNADKVLLTYMGSSNYGYAHVGTISGTSISLGTGVQIHSGQLSSQEQALSSVFDPDTNQIAVGLIDNSDSARPKCTTNSCEAISVQYHAVAQKVVVAYRKTSGTDDLRAAVGTVSGTGISFASDFVVDNTDSGSPVYTYVSLVYDSNLTSLAVGYKSYDSNNRRFRCNVFQIAHNAPNLTSENFIGFAENDCTDNGLATIQLGGSVNDKQTGLTAGQTYFVQTDGTIGTTAGSPSVTAGTAVSATEILVKG